MDALFANIELWMESLGGLAYVVAPLIMAAVSILPIPAEGPAMANGMLFGPVVGTLMSWSGAMAGAWISYEIARGWGRPVAERFVKDEAIARVDRAAESAGWWGLLALRFIPVVAFTALNWGSGLCGVPRGRFLWTTALGIAPGAVVFTSTGVGLSALWRRSPSLAAATVGAVLVVSAVWVMRRRQGATVG
jgi:uncharacterized membrane protein YdjX (TVP38/TMEM64 family)